MVRVLCLLAALWCSGCVASRYPLEPPADAPAAGRVDPRLVGNWDARFEGESLSLTIVMTGDQLRLYGELLDSDGARTTTNNVIILLCRLGGQSFASVQQAGETGRPWALFRYRFVDDDTLVANWLDEKFVRRAVKRGLISAEMETQWGKPLLTADPVALRAFVLAHADAMFAGDSIEMHRRE